MNRRFDDAARANEAAHAAITSNLPDFMADLRTLIRYAAAEPTTTD